ASAEQFVYMSASGIIGLALGDYFGYHSMAILGVKQYSIFITIAPGAALIFGNIVLGENIDLIGVAGIVISIAGMIWFLKISEPESVEGVAKDKYGTVKKGVLFGILSGLIQGFHITLSKKGMIDGTHQLTPMYGTWIRIFAATVGYFLFTFAQGKLKRSVIDVIRHDTKHIPKAAYATVFGMVLSVILVMWSITLCKVAVAQTILSMMPIVAVPAAYILHKEKITLKAMAAAVVSILGVIVLIWREDIVVWMQLHLH
ncbi:MAG TPA: DMT family transporter, partial [Bacteroidia bacterium]|nr:DMT family transporter [Bacteroidia bacterium]